MSRKLDRFFRRESSLPHGEPPSGTNLLAIVEALFGPDGRYHLLRLASHVLVAGVGLATVWLAGLSVPQLPALPVIAFDQPAPAATPAVAPTVEFGFLPGELPNDWPPSSSLTRLAQVHTNLPSRPRGEIQSYIVQPGDTLFGIAQKFGLSPETVVWSNRIVLQDDPHSLRPGMEFKIPPVDGVLYQVQEGDTLKGIASGTSVTEADIVDWPSNQLDIDNPQITVGQYLMIPGGTGKLYQWEPPAIRREAVNVVPLTAGAGACPGGYSGAVGNGYFVWPTDARYLSGTDFTSFHGGLDLAAGLGRPIYAADSGVVVWAGPNNYGYGNLVIIDHGNGWQTLYAHLSQWNVSCGQSIPQGQVLGLAGSTGNSTGPHLHFEAAYNGVRISPWTVLPA